MKPIEGRPLKRELCLKRTFYLLTSNHQFSGNMLVLRGTKWNSSSKFQMDGWKC